MFVKVKKKGNFLNYSREDAPIFPNKSMEDLFFKFTKPSNYLTINTGHSQLCATP